MSDKNQLARELRAIELANKIADLRPRWMRVPHDRGQVQMLQSRHKIRVAIPGNGWGKTTAMGMAADMLIQKDDPYNPDMLPAWAVQGIWVCQKFQQMDLLRAQLEDEVWTRPWKWNQSRHFYEWPNGGRLFIVSGDSDWKHIQGVPVDFVCFDEHPDRKLWNELMFRRRGKRKTRYLVAATMTQGITWFVNEVIRPWEEHHRDQGLVGDAARDKQLHDNIWVWDKGGIRDNPAVDQEDIEHYEQIGHASDKELRVRLEGGYADFTGESVFCHDSLDRQLQNISKGTSGSLELCETSEAQLIVPDGYDTEELLGRRIGRNARHYVNWRPEGLVDAGTITMWEPPRADLTYVIGADFAAGLEGRDYDAAVVLAKRSDGQVEQVAEARGWWGDAMFAEILYMLGTAYFNAFLVGERQFGLPAMRRLYDEYGYGYIFRGRNETTRSRRVSDQLGHHRSPGDTIIPNLRSALIQNHIILRSPQLMEELRQYQYRPRSGGIDMDTAMSHQLITGAPAGMNDDLVMALAYSWHATKEVGRFNLPPLDYSPGTYGHLFQNGRVLRGLKKRRVDSM